jgi:hypothetical protein
MSIDLLSVRELLAIPEPEWLVENFIHTQEVGVLYGKPNGGKSFVALDWALSIAAGVPWLGKYPTRQGPVLYMAGEGGPSLQKRVEAWLAVHDLEDVPVHFQVRPIHLLDEQEIEEIQAVLDGFRNDHDEKVGLCPALIVVDTLSQFMMGGDENGPDMALFVSNLRKLSQDEMTAVLIVHHTNKGGEQERGHTALRGNVDVMFKIEGQEDPDGKLKNVTILNDKQRDNTKAEPEKLAAVPSSRSLTFCSDKKGFSQGLSVELSSETLMNLLLVADKIEDPTKEILSTTEWQLESGLLPADYHRKRHILMNLKLIKAAGRGQYAFTPKGRETMMYYRKVGWKKGIYQPSNQSLPPSETGEERRSKAESGRKRWWVTNQEDGK